MDKKEFYQKSEKMFNDALEAVKKYAKIAAEKTGEVATVTKLLIQKATLEHQIAKVCSQLGSKIYDRAVRKGETIDLSEKDLKAVVDEIKKLEQQHADVETVLAKERSKQKTAKPKAAKK
jgi:phage FluMu protein gp41